MINMYFSHIDSSLFKIRGTVCCPVSGQYQYPDTENKNSIFEAPFSVIGKQSIRMKAEYFSFKMKVLAS